MEPKGTIDMVCAHIRNHFIDGEPREAGPFELKNGRVKLPDGYREGQRLLLAGGMFAGGSYRITGKKKSGGGFAYTLEGLEGVDDTLSAVYGQRMPPRFLSLCGEIAEWLSENGRSNVASHSVGGYYSETAATGKDGLPAGWESVFAKELSVYRKQIFTGVSL